MNKFVGITIGEYEVVNNNVIEDDEYEYEEITIDELLDRNNFSDLDKKSFMNSYSAVNIHQLLALETYDSCFKLLEDVKNDDRLSGLNAIVFLMLKPKGNRNKFHAIDGINQFSKLIDAAQSIGVKIGMDSCTAPLMLQYAKIFNQESIIPSIEPCESFGLFSSYINVFGDFFPCSFSEGEGEWEKGISVLHCEDFIKDIWFSEKLNKWRRKSLDSTKSCTQCSVQKYCRSCPIFNITLCKNTPIAQ